MSLFHSTTSFRLTREFLITRRFYIVTFIYIVSSCIECISLEMHVHHPHRWFSYTFPFQCRVFVWVCLRFFFQNHHHETALIWKKYSPWCDCDIIYGPPIGVIFFSNIFLLVKHWTSAHHSFFICLILSIYISSFHDYYAHR